MLKEKYFLTVIGTFEKGTLEYESHPTDTEIKESIKKLNGTSARIEKRYVLQSEQTATQ